MSTRGIYVVAYGENARACGRVLLASIKVHMPDVPVMLIADEPIGIEDWWLKKDAADAGARAHKLAVFETAPPSWESVLYLDADTKLTASIEPLFQWLEDGWDMVFTPDYIYEVQGHMQWYSAPQQEVMKPFYPLLQLNGGVFGFRRNERTQAFMQAWYEEWARFRERDQMALTRALLRAPVRMMALGHEWNTFVHRRDKESTAGILHYPTSARQKPNEKHRAVQEWKADHRTPPVPTEEEALPVKEQPMTFFTVADSKYTAMVRTAGEQIQRWFPSAVYAIYDIGLTEADVETLGQVGKVIPYRKVLEEKNLLPGEPKVIPVDERFFVRNEARGLHKPYVCMDALVRFETDYIVQLDADAMPRQRFAIPSGFHVGVTLRNPADMKLLSGAIRPYYGLLNSGVILFRRSPEAVAFVEQWKTLQESMAGDPALVDQKPLNALVEGCQGFDWDAAYHNTYRLDLGHWSPLIRVLTCAEWNCTPGKDDPAGAKIIHFKGGSQKEFHELARRYLKP